jgi:hypothetical protein
MIQVEEPILEDIETCGVDSRMCDYVCVVRRKFTQEDGDERTF